jgi:hypothetical protein
MYNPVQGQKNLNLQYLQLVTLLYTPLKELQKNKLSFIYFFVSMNLPVSWLASQTHYGDGSGEGKAFELGCAANILFEAKTSEYDANIYSL